MVLAKNIRYLRKKFGFSQEDIAKIFGYKSFTTIQKWETEDAEPPFKHLKTLSELFSVDMNSLATIDLEKEAEEKGDLVADIGGVPYKPTHRIPILGHISAGLPLYAEEHIDGYTFTDLNGGAEYFALRVRGDSMNAVNINDGNLLICRRQPIVDNGQIAVVLVDDENATVKRFYQDGNTVTLMPQSTNPTHQPQRYDLSTTSILILGKVVKNEISFE